MSNSPEALTIKNALYQVERLLFDRMIMTPHFTAKRRVLAERYWAAYQQRKEWEANS